MANDIGEQGNDGMFHSGERLGWEFVLRCPRVKFDHGFSHQTGRGLHVV